MCWTAVRISAKMEKEKNLTSTRESESECVRRLGKSMITGGKGIERERKREREPNEK
mgnify:CR=1 FL=1